MKSLILAALLTVLSLNVVAQKTEKVKKETVPQAVEQAFKKDFPTVKKVTWIAEDTNFEAEFHLDGKATSANYDKRGKLVELEKGIKIRQLPASTLNYIRKNYSSFKITEAAKITRDKKITYEAEITKSGKFFDLIFDAKGNFVKKY